MKNFSLKAINNKKDKIMKKQYMTPEMEILEADLQQVLLAGSVTVPFADDETSPEGSDAPMLSAEELLILL